MFCPECGIEERSANQFCRGCGADLRRVRAAIAHPDEETTSTINTESHEEKRRARLRTGIILASLGLGLSVALSVVAAFALGPKDRVEYLCIAGIGVVVLLVGIAFIINGYLLTVPHTATADKPDEGDRQRELDSVYEKPELPQPSAQSFVSSVTEPTTKHLKEKQRR